MTNKQPTPNANIVDRNAIVCGTETGWALPGRKHTTSEATARMMARRMAKLMTKLEVGK